MQFFFLVIINVFIGAVLYLVISLKLERSAQEFRSRRLRKEMDEIIKEFNATAERNITLLDNRIGMLQRLLERTGDLKSLDISIGEEPLVDTKSDPAADGKKLPGADGLEEHTGMTAVTRSILRRVRSGLASLANGAADTRIAREIDTGGVGKMNASPITGNDETSLAETTAEDAMVQLEDHEIREILHAATNRYDAISRLHERGCSLESLSKCSGIPAGEIALVLNLQNTRTS